MASSYEKTGMVSPGRGVNSGMKPSIDGNLKKQASGGVANPTTAKGGGAKMGSKKMNTPRKKQV